jgi:hypothetical protein
LNDEKAGKRFEALEKMQANLEAGNRSSRGGSVPASASPVSSADSSAQQGKMVPYIVFVISNNLVLRQEEEGREWRGA